MSLDTLGREAAKRAHAAVSRVHVPDASAVIERRQRRRTKRLVGAGTISALVIAAVIAVGVSARSPATRHLQVVANPDPTATTLPIPFEGLPIGLTAQQLDAHLGVGVPNGWVPVDEGNARVFVPKDWTLEPQGMCIGDLPAAGIIGVGDLPHIGCSSAGPSLTTEQAVALIPSSDPHTGAPALTVRGYRIYDYSPTTPDAIWNWYDVPQLGVRIAVHGTLSSRILDTLAPSARNVALATDEAIPNTWTALTQGDVSLSIPPSWSVATAKYAGCQWSNIERELLLMKPGLTVADCPGRPTAGEAVHNGAYLFLPNTDFAPSPDGNPVTTLRNDTTAITVYGAYNDPNALHLFIHLDGSSITHVLTLGLGGDGRVAGGVLASIRATT